jgi:hypothetical protein
MMGRQDQRCQGSPPVSQNRHYYRPCSVQNRKCRSSRKVAPFQTCVTEGQQLVPGAGDARHITCFVHLLKKLTVGELAALPTQSGYVIAGTVRLTLAGGDRDCGQLRMGSHTNHGFGRRSRAEDAPFARRDRFSSAPAAGCFLQLLSRLILWRRRSGCRSKSVQPSPPARSGKSVESAKDLPKTPNRCLADKFARTPQVVSSLSSMAYRTSTN